MNRAKAFEDTSVDPASKNPVITAPLPELQHQHVWKNADHPRLETKDASHLHLFRFLDLDVRLGQQYRYRVRLKVIRGDDRPQNTGRNEAFWTRWSEPSDLINI
ncbi:MAG: hypothetical protein M3552_18915 [Planctomycetota bacterium]|nr:hypothetical protein [Planctomycetota bacterium]